MVRRNQGRDEYRLAVATQAFKLVEHEIRPFLENGGRLWTQGSQGYPSRLRKLLEKLDVDCPVTHATVAAMLLPERERIIEHVLPMKRLGIEIIDPRQADPRVNSSFAPIADGPATSPQHLITIFDQLLEKCWVTKDEHDLLNRAGSSMQWDAPNGNGWLRYEQAGVVTHEL